MNVRVCVYVYICIYIYARTFYVSLVVLDLDQSIERENNHFNPTNLKLLSMVNRFSLVRFECEHRSTFHILLILNNDEVFIDQS